MTWPITLSALMGIGKILAALFIAGVVVGIWALVDINRDRRR